jgi:hypothetical protein
LRGRIRRRFREALADGFDLGGLGGLEAEFVRLVVEGEVFDFMTLQRPVELVFQVADELFEGVEAAEVHEVDAEKLKS